MDSTAQRGTSTALPVVTTRRWSVRTSVATAVIALLAVVPLAAAVAGEPFYVTLVSRIMIFGLAALGLNLILGYGAMVSFGHALYIGVGAYAVGILSFHGVSNGFAHLATALAVGLVLATIIGVICLRASGIAFIMITLAFGQMFYFLAVSLKQYGGDDGYAIPMRSDFGGVDLNDNTVLYYVIYGVLVAMLFVYFRLIHARFGMVLRGCRQNERRMRAMGIATLKFRLIAYVISALTCVLAGVLLANLTRFMSPSYLHWSASGDILLMAVLGGVGTLIGPLIGAAVWLVLEEVLSSFSLGLPWGLDALVRSHWAIVLGAFVVIVAIGLKEGLYGYLVARDEAAS